MKGGLHIAFGLVLDRLQVVDRIRQQRQRRHLWSGQGIIVVAHDSANKRLTVPIPHLPEFAIDTPLSTTDTPVRPAL